MNGERYRLKGMQQDLKMQSMELVTAGKSHIAAIREQLSGASVRPLDEIDAPSVLFHARELDRISREHKEAQSKIRDIDKELE